MGTDLSKIKILDQREIEARIAGPLINAMIQEFGEDKALDLARKVIARLARDNGKKLAKKMGDNSLASFAKGLTAWGASGSLEIEELELTDQRYFFNVKRCRYAEMYRDLGLQNLGTVLSCQRDFKLVEGFNPKMRIERSMTIMDGHDHCDFRITMD